jgi:hypothetical protein
MSVAYLLLLLMLLGGVDFRRYDIECRDPLIRFDLALRDILCHCHYFSPRDPCLTFLLFHLPTLSFYFICLRSQCLLSAA